MAKTILSEEKIREVCAESTSIADFCRKVGWQPKGNNYKIFHKYEKQYNLDTSHFTGLKSNLGNKNNNGISNEEFFKKDKLIKSKDLIKKLVSSKEREYKCKICGLSEWNNKEIRLQIHHIDGDHFNNEIFNLQLLCPNCHSQTDTYAGNKNKTSNHVYTRVRKYTCSVCGKPLHRNPKTGMCKECFIKSLHPELNNISIVNLLTEIINTSIISVARKYNISDNGLCKWLKNTYQIDRDKLKKIIETKNIDYYGK